MPKIEQAEFDKLVADLKMGSDAAAAKLVRLYEPEIRREVRLRLTDSRLRRALDSMDICQSVLGNFFVRTAVGQFNFDRPEQLLRLLSQMARNKVIDRHRRETVRRPKNGNSLLYGELDRDFVAANQQNSPSEIVAAEEMLNHVQNKLTPDEIEISKLRRDGKTWDEIAEEVGGTANSVRKRLSRACDRIFDELDM